LNIRNRIIEQRLVTPDEVAPNPRNWRTHPQSQRDALRGILGQVGIAAPVIAYYSERAGNRLMLIDGHERMTVGVPFPCAILDVDDAEADTLLATFDPITAMATANNEALDALLRDVTTDSPALTQMLAELAEDAGLYADTPTITEDDVPEPPVDPITKPGDLWILGEHRLLCGDSTKAENVERLMAGAKADCMVTDPPYGIGIASNPVRQKHAKADWDEKPIEPRAFVETVSRSIVWGGNYFDLPPAKGFFVWDKKQPENLTLAMCEMAWTNVDTPAKMFRLAVTSYDKEHPTQKPVALLAWCLSYTSGDVFDPFLGSGTTLIAAEQLGRKCYGMEISPAYCDVIVNRWETLTGKKAVRVPLEG